MEWLFDFITIIILTNVAVWLEAKLIEATFDLITFFKASKDPHHPARKASSGIVWNKKTQKLEAASGKIVLPFGK